MRTRGYTVFELCAMLRANPRFYRRPPREDRRARDYFLLIRRLVQRSENAVLGLRRRRRRRKQRREAIA